MRLCPAVLLPLLCIVSACEHSNDAPLPPRVVRTQVVATTNVAPKLELPGEVRARVESALGFQVGGRLQSRHADTGMRVKRGEELARLDPRDLSLALDTAHARLDSARADLTLARAERDRAVELHRQGFAAASTLDARQSALAAAESRLREAESGLALQKNQKDYAVLRADADGVVTGVEASAGEVVAAGKPVVRIARDGAREVQVVFAEDQQPLAKAGEATVALWAHPDNRFPARLRELSASADPVTRTFVARYSVEAPADTLALGQTATLRLAFPERMAIRLATPAVFGHEGASAVWRFEADPKTEGASPTGHVTRVPVGIVGVDGNGLLVTGLQPGDVIVTAGVHALRDGQTVRQWAQ